MDNTHNHSLRPVKKQSTNTQRRLLNRNQLGIIAVSKRKLITPETHSRKMPLNHGRRRYKPHDAFFFRNLFSRSPAT